MTISIQEMKDNLVAIVKSNKGVFKVYDDSEDFQVKCDNDSLKFKELWFTHHKYSYSSNESLSYAIGKFIDYNGLSNVEIIYKVIYS